MIKKSELAARIKELCAKTGASVSEVERASGYSIGMISRWASTDEDFNVLTKLVAMADHLHVSLDCIVGRKAADAAPASEIIEFPVQNIARYLLDETVDCRLLWKKLSDGDEFPLQTDQIPENEYDGQTFAEALWCRCDDLSFLLLSFCDNVEDLNEPMTLSLYCLVGHGFPLQKVYEADTDILQALYTRLRMNLIMENRRSSKAGSSKTGEPPVYAPTDKTYRTG